MNTEECVFHLGMKVSNWERRNAGTVTHSERNVAISKEVITMSVCLGDTWPDDPFHTTLSNHIRIRHVYLGDSLLDDVFHITSSRYQSLQNIFGYGREMTSYIVHSSSYSRIQLQGLNVVFKSWGGMCRVVRITAT